MHFYVATGLTEGPTDRDVDEQRWTSNPPELRDRDPRNADPTPAKCRDVKTIDRARAGRLEHRRRWLIDRFEDPVDADRLIARAIESVLDAVPEIPGGDMLAVEASPKAQPWAETAAPPASDKRPLKAVLAEYEARVASAPGARAGHPNEPHPGDAYLEKLSPAPRSTGKRPKRRWQGGRKRRGGRGWPWWRRWRWRRPA